MVRWKSIAGCVFQTTPYHPPLHPDETVCRAMHGSPTRQDHPASYLGPSTANAYAYPLPAVSSSLPYPVQFQAHTPTPHWQAQHGLPNPTLRPLHRSTSVLLQSTRMHARTQLIVEGNIPSQNPLARRDDFVKTHTSPPALTREYRPASQYQAQRLEHVR